MARRPRRVLILFVLAIALMGALGAGLFPRLQAGGYDDPGSESSAAQSALADRFGVDEPVAVLAVEVSAGVDDSAGAAQATALVTAISEVPGVNGVTSYWTSGQPAALRGSDGRTGQVLVQTSATTEDDRAAVAERVRAVADGAEGPGLATYVGGTETVNDALNTTITEDLARAESVAVPITFLLLLLVFGSVVSAGLPFLVALGSIVGSFFAVWLVSLTT
jgi:RND superfamily putative drug exporter